MFIYAAYKLNDFPPHILQKLHSDLELEKERRTEAQTSLDNEKVVCAGVRRDLELERSTRHHVENKYKGRIAELRTAIELDRAKNEEINRYRILLIYRLLLRYPASVIPTLTLRALTSTTVDHII